MSDFIYNQNGTPMSNYTELPDKRTDSPVYVQFKTPEDNGNKGKNKHGMRTGVAILLCVLTVILSCGAGFGGAYLYSTYFKDNTAVAEKTGESTVVHRSVVEQYDYDETANMPIASVVAKVADSVVEIETEYRSVSQFYQYISAGAGSGVIISEDGYIMTNNHVIVDDSDDVADSILVRLRTGEEFEAKVIGKDADSDIAIIKIEATGLSYATFGDSDKLVVGEEVIAVGNPLGELGGTVTNGIISALGRDVNVEGTKMKLLQTNAAVNPGNSGGGLFNMRGELIGIVNAGSAEEGVEGIGFAIPVNDAYAVMEQLLEYGYVRGKTFLGIAFQDITNAMTAYYYFGSTATGVYVTEVQKLYNTGNIEVGDRVIIFGGVEIESVTDIKSVLSEHSVGDTIEATVMRKGKAVNITLTCFEKVPSGIDFGGTN